MTLAPLLLCIAAGCSTVNGGGITMPWTKKADAKVAGPKDTFTMGGSAQGGERGLIDPAVRAELDTAQRLFQEKKFAEAEKIYYRLAQPDTSSSNTNAGVKEQPENSLLANLGWSGKYRGKHPRIVYEEAMFGTAECQREQKNFRDAADSYHKVLVDFPHTQYKRASCKAIFDIANHWLRPTATQMDETFEQMKGKRTFVMPVSYINFGKDMPFLDAEGHAINMLNVVRLHDINGPLAEQSLWCLGTIQFYRKDYKEADSYFRQVYEQYPNSDYAGRAVKQSVICKQLIAGDSVYDSRSVEEAKNLLMRAQASFPELQKDNRWSATQLASMNIHQADRDFKIAEFYERTGHPGSAYFYYELVCRRYGGTQHAEKALQRKLLLKGQADREQRKDRGDTVPTASTPSPALQGPSVPGTPNALPPGLSVPPP